MEIFRRESHLFPLRQTMYVTGKEQVDIPIWFSLADPMFKYEHTVPKVKPGCNIFKRQLFVNKMISQYLIYS